MKITRNTILFIMFVLLFLSTVSCKKIYTAEKEIALNDSNNTENSIQNNAFHPSTDDSPTQNNSDLHKTPTFPQEISYSVVLEIEEAWDNKFGNSPPWYNPEKPTSEFFGLRCYGTYHDYVILFKPGNLTIESKISIGEKTFVHPSSFNLYAYKDGVFYDLKGVYENGGISSNDIDTIFQHHQNTQK